MVHALLTFAAEAAGEESSHTAFYVAGGLLALAAVAVSFVGMSRKGAWPSGAGGRGVIGLFLVLVAATLATAVITA